ncbi:MAG: hypothetical protein AAGJ87_14420, partial [Pseudomonadota bacterium]
MIKKSLLAGAAGLCAVSVCAAADNPPEDKTEPSAQGASPASPPKLTFAGERDEALPDIKVGNGKNNYVVIEGVKRQGA